METEDHRAVFISLVQWLVCNKKNPRSDLNEDDEMNKKHRLLHQLN